MLCHDCFHWVIPEESWCVECGSHFDLSEADPDTNFINDVIGDFQREIGEVQINHSKSSSLGKLFETENGLLFSPYYHYEDKPPFLIKKRTRKSLKFSLKLFSDSPIDFKDPDPKSSLNHEEAQFKPEKDLAALHSPADYLLSHPGVFFISYQAIHSIHKLFYRWKLERTYGGSFWIKPVVNHAHFHFDMQELNSRITFKAAINL